MEVPPNHPCLWDSPLETIHSGVPPLMETPQSLNMIVTHVVKEKEKTC